MKACPTNVAWARKVAKAKAAFLFGSLASARKRLRQERTVILSLVGQDVALYYDDEDNTYGVKGGPRGDIYCTSSFDCALGTFIHELARTVPA